jgi:hypothetical protein
MINYNILTEKDFHDSKVKMIEEFRKHEINIINISYKLNPIYKDFARLDILKNDSVRFWIELMDTYYFIMDLDFIKQNKIKDYNYYKNRIWIKNYNINIYGEKFELGMFRIFNKKNHCCPVKKTG